MNIKLSFGIKKKTTQTTHSVYALDGNNDFVLF